LQESWCRSVAETVVATLKESSYSVIVQNLYDKDGISWEIEWLTSAELLVLVFPTWWFGFPAVLKGLCLTVSGLLSLTTQALTAF